MSEKPDLAKLFGATAETRTFLGLPSCSNLDALGAPIALIAAAGATPYASVGAYCRNAPSALRRVTGSMAANLDRHDFDSGGPVFPATLRAADCGDLPFDEADSVANREAIRAAIAKIVAHGARPVLIGGDDFVPTPMLEALGLAADGAKYTILQIDAHIDWRDVHMGERFGLSSTMRRASEMPHIERIIQIGARGIGSAASSDYEDALDWGVRFITAREFHARGVDAALRLIPDGSRIVLCIDADALDPALIPGVIRRAPGGLNYYQVADLIQGAAQRGTIVAADFVEYMPERDVDDIGALTFARLITTTLGTLARQEGR